MDNDLNNSMDNNTDITIDIDNFLSKITKNVNIEDDEEYEYNSELSYELYSYSSDEELEKDLTTKQI